MTCSSCGLTYPSRLQFKVGEVWQYHYSVGDRIKKSESDPIEKYKIHAYGILEDGNCANCDRKNGEDCDILIENELITGYSITLGIEHYQRLNNARFYIVD